jgi:hypothetical protein
LQPGTFQYADRCLELGTASATSSAAPMRHSEPDGFGRDWRTARCTRRAVRHSPGPVGAEDDTEPEKLEVELTPLLETGRVCRPRRVMITSTQCRGNIEENDFVTRVSELGNRLGYRDDCLDLAGKDREFIAKGLAGRDAVVR